MTVRVIFESGTGVAVLIPASDCGLSLAEIIAKDIPDGVALSIVSVASLPVDRVFRDAWEEVGDTVVENIGKCKLIAHEKRRMARAVELAPLDIEATIPAKAAQAEAARQVVRERNAKVQVDIDAANDAGELRAIMVGLVA